MNTYSRDWDIGTDGRGDILRQLKDFDNACDIIREGWTHIRQTKSIKDIAVFMGHADDANSEFALTVTEFITTMDCVSDVATCMHETGLNKRRCLNLCSDEDSDFCDTHTDTTK